MPTAAQLRQFVRSIDAANVAVWACDEGGQILLASQRTGELVGCDADDLIGLQAMAGRSADADPLLAAAAKLTPPAGVKSAGAVCASWTFGHNEHVAERTVVFSNSGDAASITVAVEMPNHFDASSFGCADTGIAEAIQLRQALVAHRKTQSSKLHTYLAGQSLASTRLRRQFEIARRLRDDTLVLAPIGFPTDAVAHYLHATTTDDDDTPMEFIDGSLMDIELLEAVGSPLIGHLTSSDVALATAAIRDIDQMPLDVQARVAQWKAVFGDRLRIIAFADHESTVAVIEHADWLRPELGETLGAMFVVVPPLKSRPDDLDVLSTAILEFLRVESTGSADRISRDAMDTLVRYPWPGDVRELEDALRHAVGVCLQDAIGRDHLPLVIRSYRADAGHTDLPPVDLDEVLRSVERRLIEQTLEATDGNRAEAARRLGISRARLIRRISDVRTDDDE